MIHKNDKGEHLALLCGLIEWSELLEQIDDLGDLGGHS